MSYMYKYLYVCCIKIFHVPAQEQLQEADQTVESAKKMLLEAETAAAAPDGSLCGLR